jgi:hypothetical protein
MPHDLGDIGTIPSLASTDSPIIKAECVGDAELMYGLAQT